jgi:hypothetical protein
MDIAGLDFEPYEYYPDTVLQGGAGWYDEQLFVLRKDVIRLNAALAALRTLAEYPWALYQPSEEFLSRLVPTSLYEHCIIIVFRLWCDTDSGSLGLRRFKNRIMAQLRPWFNTAVTGRLREFRITDEIEATILKVQHLRHKRVGHSDHGFHANPRATGEWPSLAQLQEVAAFFSGYLAILSFPKEDGFVGGSSEHNVQHYLDLLALDSDFNIHLEQDSRSWRWTLAERDGVPEPRDAVRDLNERRARHGLEPLKRE